MYGVKEMCRVLGVSRSRYYAQLNTGGSKRQREDQSLLVSIKASFDGSDKTYGADRIRRELREQGVCVGKNRVWRLMKQHGLRVKTIRRFKVTTNSDHKRPIAPNLVKRNFTAPAPDRLWTGDITYIWTAEVRYIEGFYNRRRRHSSIGYQAPEEYERLFVKAAV